MINRWVCLMGGMAALVLALLLGCRNGGPRDRQTARVETVMGDAEMNVWVGGNQVTMQLVARATRDVEVVDVWYAETAQDSAGTPLMQIVDSDDSARAGNKTRARIVTWHYTAFSKPVGGSGYVPPVTVTVVGYVKFRAPNGTEETNLVGPLTVQIQQ